MTTFDIRPATAADNHAILGLIGQPQPSNGVNFAFERLPDYFTSAQISHQQPHTLVVERRDNKEVVAMVNMGFREVFVDGQPKQIRYGSDLRIAPEYQGSRVLIYINRAVKDCVQNDWYQSVILEENDKSRSALEGGRAGLPIYRSLGTISTHTITGRKALFTPHKQIRRAQIADIPAMNAFIKQMAEHYQFLPRYDFYQLTHHHPYFNGLNIDDFLVLFDDEQLVGLVGLWNQKNFKQTRVVDYNRTVAMFRPIYNWWSRLTGGFVLPAKGQLVDYIALHSPLTHPKDSDSFRHLLHHAWLEVRQQQKAAMTLTLADTDPRLSVLADFKTIPLTAYQYAVAFKEPLLPILDNQRIPYFESGEVVNTMTATHWQQYKGQIGLWAMVLAVLWWWPEESTSKYSSSEPFIELSSVDVVTVQQTRIAHDIAVTGTIAPVRQTILNARVLGEVKQVSVREGQSVKAGQVLVVQDDRDLVARLQQSEASLLTAKAELALAQQNLDRIKPLQQQNYASSNDLANAERQVDIRHAQVKSAEVSVIQAKQQLADMAVRAPYAGTVSERLVDAGQSVAPNTPLLKLVDLSQVELIAQVAATEVAAIKVGQVIYFTADGYADQTFAGRITRINPVAKAGSRRVDVYALVNNQKGLLRGGLFAKGYVRDDQAQQGVAVPFSAVQERQGQKVVHVIRDNRLVAQKVNVGRRDEAKSLALVTGLQAGERVLLLPPLPQNEGRIVRFKDGR